MKTPKLQQLAQDSPYSQGNKDLFRALAMKTLKQVRELLGDNGDCRFLVGGIAVSGDAVYHSDSIYISIGSTDLGILVRTVTSRKDYTGGCNQWFSWAQFAEFGAKGLAQFSAQIVGREESRRLKAYELSASLETLVKS
jgi:hypothetical protein